MNDLNDDLVTKKEQGSKIEEQINHVVHILEVAVETSADSQSVLQTSQESCSEEVVEIGLMFGLKC